MHCAYSKVWQSYGVVMFVTVWTGTLDCAIYGKLNANSYSTILDKAVLSTLWQIFGLDPCYFQDDNATCHVARSTTDWYDYYEVN
ncbi:hypothetical protein TNCT_189141 [Trichonephila clavata]|uniref:Transposase n=1 Tax=Trichonephila clavata TaxID=2740835 RepID=A0A8X6K5C6_TRICU|nr:hypothetical protein TNCT_189141 [Trichonephila clavata]